METSWSTTGGMALPSFFVVSAYTLCLSMAPAFDGEGVSWTAYFVRRFFRIAPLYWVTLAFVLYNFAGSRTGGLASALAHFSFANIFLPQYGNDILNVEWSIAVEFAFYLLLPIFIFACRHRLGVLALMILFVVSYREQVKFLYWLGEPYWSNRPYTILYHLQPFLIGIFTFMAVRAKLVGTRTMLLIAAVCLCGLYMTLRYGEGGWSEAFISCCTAGAIISCESDGHARRPLSFIPLTLIGTISYSIYLTHFVILNYLAFPPQLGPNQVALAQFVLSIGISIITYFAVEQPGRRLGAKLIAWGRFGKSTGHRIAPAASQVATQPGVPTNLQ
jgi:peptidoglycan/LPS O-acetylase OafA/YrhL